MANPEHVAIVKQGWEAIAAWREANPERQLVLRAANFRFAKLRDADLSDAHLTSANLHAADLRAANLSFANLSDADLSDANLRAANLSGADLRAAYLKDADLSGVDLSGADLRAARLSSADLSGIRTNRDTKFDGVIVDDKTKGIGPWVFNPDKHIIRAIEFPPEYRQAGIGIMNYFAEVMRQKYPDIPATVQITQEDLTVRMTIETNDGHRETVEQALNDYGLVVAGQRQPVELLADPIAIMGLENRLEIAQMELRLAHKQHQLSERQYDQRIESLESEVAHLRQLVGGQLSLAGQLAGVLETQALAPLLARGLSPADEPAVKKLLAQGEKHSPGTLQRLAEQITSGTIGELNAELLKPWLLEAAKQAGVVLSML